MAELGAVISDSYCNGSNRFERHELIEFIFALGTCKASLVKQNPEGKRHKQQTWIKGRYSTNQCSPNCLSYNQSELSKLRQPTNTQVAGKHWGYQQLRKHPALNICTQQNSLLILQPYLLRHSWRIWYGDKSPALLVSSYTRESSILIWLKYYKRIENSYCGFDPVGP